MNYPNIIQTSIFNLALGFITGVSYLLIVAIIFGVYLGWHSTLTIDIRGKNRDI